MKREYSIIAVFLIIVFTILLLLVLLNGSIWGVTLCVILAPICSIIIVMGTFTIKTQKDKSNDEEIQHLKMRFTKGEITEEEFEKMRKKLEG